MSGSLKKKKDDNVERWGVECDYSTLKGSERNNTQDHCGILDWILFPKTILKAPKFFLNNWKNLNLAWILDDIMKLLLIFL